MTEGVRPVRARCAGCRFEYQVAAHETSPLIAKTVCPNCERINEVVTRESNYAYFDRLMDEQKEKDAHNRRAPVVSKDAGMGVIRGRLVNLADLKTGETMPLKRRT